MTIYNLTLTKEQLDNLAGFVDAGVKALGLGCVRKAADALDVLESAKEVTEPKVAKVVPGK